MLESKINIEFKTKEEWRKLIELGKNGDKYKQIISELISSKKLSSDWKNNFDIRYYYPGNGCWSRWPYGISLGRDLFFVKEQDAINYRDAILEYFEEHRFPDEEKHNKSEYPIVQYRVTEDNRV